MAKKAAKAKSRVKSKKKSRVKAKARKTKVAVKKKKVAKKAAARKQPPSRKKPTSKAKKAAKKPRGHGTSPIADSTLNLRVDDTVLSPAAGRGLDAVAAKPAALNDDEVKSLAVARCVDAIFAAEKKTKKPNEPLKDADTVTSLISGEEAIIAILGNIRDCLKRNNPSFTFTITRELVEKCASAGETIRTLKGDIGRATKSPAIVAARELTRSALTASAGGEAKSLAVARCVDLFFAAEKRTLKPNEPLKDSDTMSFFNFDTTSIIAVLGNFRAQLQNNIPRFTLTITRALSDKCGAASETIRDLKRDINGATT